MTSSLYFNKEHGIGSADNIALDWDKESVDSDPEDFSSCKKKSTYVY